MAGAAFDDDFDGESAHARLTTSFRFGNVDMRRYLDFWMLHQTEFNEIMQRACTRRHLAAGAPDAVRLGRTVPHAEDGGLLRAQRRRSHRGGVRLPRRGSQRLGVLPRERARVRTRPGSSTRPRRWARGTPGVSSVPSGSRSTTGATTAATSTASACVPGMTPSFPTLRDSVPQPAARQHEGSARRWSQPLGRHQVARRAARDPAVLGDGRSSRRRGHPRGRQRRRSRATSTYARCRPNS